MKKYFYIIPAALIAIAACNKEADVHGQNDNSSETPKTGYVIHASIDGLTKAAVAEADGKFTWNKDDEFIVKGDDNNLYTFKASADGASVDFVCETAPSTVSFAGQTARFPADRYDSASNSMRMYNSFASPKEALTKGLYLAATIANDGTATFTNSLTGMLKVTFNNVPSFADNVLFELASRSTTVSLSGEAGDDVVVYCPAYYPGGALTVSLRDAAGNTIMQKSTTVPAISNKLYALMPLTVNNYIAFENSNNTTHRLGLGIRDYDGNWVGSWATFDMNSCNGLKYYILPDEYANAEAIQVELRQNDGGEDYAKSKADYIIPIRSITFDVSDNSLKTNYRCYAKFTETQWGYWTGKGTSVVKFRWGYDNQPAVSESDTNCSEITVSSGKLFYYEFDSSYYGHDNVYWGFYNPNDTGWKGEWDNAIINRDYLKDL